MPASDKRVAEVEAACEPASVASRASASTARSHSSNGSSSRGGGIRMKSRKRALSAKDKGKGKETRGLSQMHRTHSNGRIHRMHIGGGGPSGGTIQRSKLGGRTAAASVHAPTLAPSQFPKQQSVRAPTGGISISMHPPSPAPVSRLAQAEKSTIASSPSGARPGAVARQSSSSQRSSRSGGSVKAGKVNGHGLASSSLKQRRLDFADDSDFSTDTEWDTEDASEEADGTSGESEQQLVVDRKLAEAAAEAQRQRDLFAKVDRRSYSDLSRVRTQPGLLSAIFHPDPQLFPPDHPYRHSRSTQDILAHTSRPFYQAAPLQPSKSTTAVPVAATVTAQGVGSPSHTHHRQRSPLRLRGRPQDVEESESGEDDDENKLHVSESVAEKRLAMLQRQTMKGARAQEPEPSKLTQHAPANRQVQQMNILPAVGLVPTIRGGAPIACPPPLARVATEPVPLGYPYNLPPPLPPSTPRTTRRNMLTHELSESLRRNLLWERQVSKQRPMGLGRRAVTGGVGPTAGPSNFRPLTSTGTTASNTNGQTSRNGSQAGGSNAANGNGTGSDAANGVPTVDEEQLAKEKRLEKVIARNRSWADNYHAVGW